MKGEELGNGCLIYQAFHGAIIAMKEKTYYLLPWRLDSHQNGNPEVLFLTIASPLGGGGGSL